MTYLRFAIGLLVLALGVVAGVILAALDWIFGDRR